MFRYSIAALACTTSVQAYVAGRIAWEDTRHVSDSCRMRNHSLLQMSGGMSRKLPINLKALRHHMYEDGITVLDQAPSDASNVTLDETRISHSFQDTADMPALDVHLDNQAALGHAPTSVMLSDKQENGQEHPQSANNYHQYVPNDDNTSSDDKASTQQEWSQSAGDHHLEDNDVAFDQAPRGEIVSQDLAHSVGILHTHDVNIMVDHTPTDAISLRLDMTDNSQKHPQARMPQKLSESSGAMRHEDYKTEFEQAPTVASTGTVDGSVMSQVLPESVDIPDNQDVNIMVGYTPTDAISLRLDTAGNPKGHPQIVDILHQDDLKKDGTSLDNNRVRMPQELSQSVDALHHYDDDVEFDQAPTNASTSTINGSVTSQELPQSVLILHNPDVRIKLDHVPAGAITLRLEKSQEHPQSANIFQQGYQYSEDDSPLLNPDPTDASTMTADEAEISPEFSQSVGILGQEDESDGVGRAPSDANNVAKSPHHAGQEPKLSQSIGILGHEGDNDSWDNTRTATLKYDKVISDELAHSVGILRNQTDTFVVPDEFAMRMQGNDTNATQETAQFVFRHYESQFPVDASTVTLDETGYQEVASLCCAEDMRIFIKRVVPAEGYTVCNESGLSGLLWWYDCPDDGNTYANLVQSIKAASSGECKWVALAGQVCPGMPDSCLIPDPEPLPACLSKTTITTSIGGISNQETTTIPTIPTITTTTLTISDITCCAPAPQASLSQVASDAAHNVTPVATVTLHGAEKAVKGMQHSVDRLPNQKRKEKNMLNVKLKTAPLDCAVYPLPIQVWAPSASSPEYSVSQLSISTGDYNEIYRIPRTTTTPAFSNLNSAGISPVDSKAYGTLTVDGSKDFYIVRHDKDGLEFVGRIPPPSTWSQKTTGYNSAAFSLSGDYYLMSKGKQQDIFVIKDLPSKLGFLNQLPAQGLSDLETEMANSKFSLGRTDRVADMAAVPMDLDGSGDLVDYAFGLDSSRVLYIVKFGDQKVMWKLKASGQGLVPASSQGFGAAWSYGQKVFFASNSGGGVYEVDMDSVDLQGLTATMKYVGKSTATTANDGMNCLDADSPWPEQGDCDQGEVQVDAVGGVCPAGSISK